MDNYNNIIFVGLIIIVVVRNLIKFFTKKEEPEKKLVAQEVYRNYGEQEDEISDNKVDSIKAEIVSTQFKEKANVSTKKPLLEDISVEENNYNLTETSEIRKAFIYSEIFNRKY